MAWIEIHQSLPNHRKTITVSETLGIAPVQVVGHLVSLWLWALDNAPDGDLSRVRSQVVAVAALWPGDSEAFVDALLRCGGQEEPGFLERVGGRLVIHDWDTYAGRLIDQRRANAERMRTKRAGTRAPHVREQSAPPVRARAPATVPNTTVPYMNKSGGSNSHIAAPDGAIETATPTAIIARRAKPPSDEPPEFAEFCAAYPGKLNRAAALVQFRKRLKGGESAADLIAAARNLAFEVEQDGVDFQFVTHAHNFLGSRETFRGYIAGVPPAPPGAIRTMTVGRARDRPDANARMAAKLEQIDRVADKMQGGGQ